MDGYVTNIERDALANEDFRRVLYTGRNLQLVLMTLQPGEDIGSEIHSTHDQFIRVESGTAYSELNGERRDLGDGSVVVVPQGVRHNIVNTSNDAPLRLYTVYSPPMHPDSTVEHRKPAAAAVGRGAGGR
jgi:mannose-6-phosphate isomerase-like protein (cupin superfamily)